MEQFAPAEFRNLRYNTQSLPHRTQALLADKGMKILYASVRPSDDTEQGV